MKTKNIFRILLMAVGLLMGVMSVQAGEERTTLTGEYPYTFNGEEHISWTSPFSDIEIGDRIEVAGTDGSGQQGFFFMGEHDWDRPFSIYDWNNNGIFNGTPITITVNSGNIAGLQNSCGFGGQYITVSSITIVKSTGFDIIVTQPENGTIAVDKAKADEDAVITLSATPDEDYYLVGYTVTDNTTGENITVDNNQFTMPASSVTVTATFAAIDYSVNGSKIIWEDSNGKAIDWWNDRVELSTRYFSEAGTGWIIRVYGIASENGQVMVKDAENNQFQDWNGTITVEDGYVDFVINDTDLERLQNSTKFAVVGSNYSLTKVEIIASAPPVPTHTLTIIVGDATTTREVAEGVDLADLLTTPTKTGYTFSGWDGLPDDGKMPEDALTVTALFTINSHTLTYLVDDEQYGEAEVLDYGTSITLRANPEKKGYSFSGWSGYPEGGTMPDNDVTISGSFTKVTFAVTYKIGDEILQVDSLDAGTTITPPTPDAREHYTFAWGNYPQTMPNEDVTVTGQYTEAPKHTLTYQLNWSETYKTYTVYEGEALPIEPDPTREGYHFEGWGDIPATMPNYDVTINGNFALNKHNIIYMVDGEVYKTVEMYYGYDIYPEQDPTQTGATFSGWSGFPDDMKMPDSDLTITGSFGVASYAVTYTYWVNGASTELRTDYVAFGSTITTPDAPEIEGYTFNGWENVPETMPANNLSISGSYTLNKYNIIYMVDGEVYKTVENYDYGATIYPEQYQAQAGETFSGWSGFPDDMKMPAHDLTITGSTGVASYTITYFIDGEQIAEESWDYGAAITSTPDAPQREGYSFSWNGVPETMPANNITINGYYSINSHDVIYLLDGNEYGRDTYQYGATIYPKNNPSSEGYDFSGWSGFPDDMTMPDEDVIILGSFSEIVYYTLTLMLDENTVYRTITLPEGIAIPYINNPVKTGYTFTGWSGDVPSTMPAEDMTLTAQFDEILYTLTFKVDNEDYGTSLQLAAGDAITLPDEPEAREGYTFSGWQNVPDYMPAQNWVIYGSFTKELEYQTLSVGEAGFNTYYTTKALYFQGSEDVKAYIAKAKNSNEVTLSQVVGSVAAGTGLVLRGTSANASAQFEVVSSGNTFSNNLMVGVSSEKTINSSNDYVLVMKDGYVKFADTENYPAVVPAGKAYLAAPAAGSRMLNIFFEESNATLIESVAAEDNGHNLEIYDLRGQRVQNPGKGLYIINGKKVYIK